MNPLGIQDAFFELMQDFSVLKADRDKLVQLLDERTTELVKTQHSKQFTEREFKTLRKGIIQSHLDATLVLDSYTAEQKKELLGKLGFWK